MTAVLDGLKLTDLIASIPGLSPVGAAAILAQTGDPNRYQTARRAPCGHQPAVSVSGRGRRPGPAG
jgi:transposase